MRATSFLVFIALAVHAAPSLATPSAPSLATRDFRSSILAARGGAATILEDGAEDAAKAVAKTSLGSTVKGAIADGLGTLLGGGVAGEILGGSNSSAKREVLEYIHARATEELIARGGVATILEDGAEDAAKAVGKTSIGSTIKGAVADGVGTLLGGGIAGSILGGSDDSSSTSSKRELDARGGAATILEDGAKAVEKTTVGSTIKGAVADGVGTLLGGGIAGEIFGNSDDSSSSSSKRELSARGGAATILEDGAKAVEKTSVGSTIKGAIADGVGTLLGGGIAGEIFGSSSDSSSSSSKRELSARGGAATIIEDGAKAARKTSLGSTIKGAVADGVGTLLGGGIAGEIFGNSDSSSKRELLEYIHARATEELAARGGAATILEDQAKAVEKTSIGSTIKGAVADGVGTLLGGGIAGEIFGNSDDSSSSSKRSSVRREYY